MIQPVEARIPLPKGGAWPSSLVALDIDPSISLERAVMEAASASRRFRQGVRSWWNDAPLVAFPSDEVHDVMNRFRRVVLDIKRVDQAVVTLDDMGSNSRWTANRKLQVLVAIGGSRMTPQEVQTWWGIDPVELSEWAQRFEMYGYDGLKSQSTQRVGRIFNEVPVNDPREAEAGKA